MDPLELLLQAGELVWDKDGLATETDLRRSVSASYYALFHAICDNAAAVLAQRFAAQRSRLKLSSAVRRTITHAQVKRACEVLTSPPKVAANSWRNLLHDPIEPELITVATVFIELQEARNSADYDSLAKFVEKEVLEFRDRAMMAHTDLLSIYDTPNAAVFLTAALLGDRFGKRG